MLLYEGRESNYVILSTVTNQRKFVKKFILKTRREETSLTN